MNTSNLAIVEVKRLIWSIYWPLNTGMFTPQLQKWVIVKKEAMQECCQKLQNCCCKFPFSISILCRWGSLTKHIWSQQNFIGVSLWQTTQFQPPMHTHHYHHKLSLTNIQVNTTISLNECNLISTVTQTTGSTTQKTGSTTGSMTGQFSIMESIGQATTMQSPTVEGEEKQINNKMAMFDGLYLLKLGQYQALRLDKQ